MAMVVSPKCQQRFSIDRGQRTERLPDGPHHTPLEHLPLFNVIPLNPPLIADRVGRRSMKVAHHQRIIRRESHQAVPARREGKAKLGGIGELVVFCL